MLTNITRFKYFLIITLTVLVSIQAEIMAQNVTRTTGSVDSLSRGGAAPVYRWKDSYLNSFSYDLSKSPFLKLNADSLQTKIYFIPNSENINVEEKMGSNLNAKLPQAMSFNEYSSLQNVAVRKSILRDYERMQDGNSNTSGRGLKPLLKKNPIVDRIFGGKAPEFKPNGFISADLRVGTSFNNNPQIPLQQRRQPIFDFDQQISVNFNSLFNNSGGNGDFNGNTGNPNSGNPTEDLSKLGKTLGGLMGAGQQARDKVNILGNIDTKSAFSFENQFKLNFQNEPEDILQSIELGNVSFPLSSQLIPGVDKLMGLKAALRFGKLDITTVLAQQTSRTESIFINGGNQSRPFEIRCDFYDENKHYFLSHFFRDQYESSLKNLPMVTSQALITRVEVYVTNRTKTVGSMRNLVGLADLGESKPFSSSITSNNTPQGVASNGANSLENLLTTNDVNFRRIDNTNIALEQIGLGKGVDFEILRGAKKLTEREFQFHPQLGYISLLTPLRNDEILAVAYEYIYNGQSYKVGELTEDYSIRSEDEVVALKLLKSSTIRNRLDNPMWDLMMKNIYSLSQGQIEREGFQLRVIYKDDATGLDSPNLPEAGVNEIPLIEIFGLDKLNYNNDRQKDGNFDYVDNVTINEIQGTVIFPQLEPFGSYLKGKLPDNLQTKYVFQELYDKTLTDAQQVNVKNKFFLRGSVQSSSKDIPLPLGASGGAVRVFSGGTKLQEGVDYQVDTQIGRIKLINPSILASGRTIRIDYERPDLFQTQIRRLFGVRFDYTVSPALRIGGTYMDLKENTPGFLTRTAIGNEPVNNTLWGVDINFKKEGNGFTRILDKLPLIQTKEPSSILLSAEFAQLIPGVNDKRVNGNAMIDDFEGARTINDLTRQPQRWRLASTPDEFNVRSTPIYGYNYKRAKISAYSVDISNYLTGFGQGNILPKAVTDAANGNLFERAFQIQDIFPGRSRPVLGQNLPTTILDLAYFPEERGMYNYNPNLTADGLLPEPKSNFGAVMRGITFDADFDNSNVEYLEFWMLNPFPSGTVTTDAYTVRDGITNRANTTGGKLVFHLGDVSEDVIPDSRFNFENGIPAYDTTGRQADSTSWGSAPRTQYVTDAFDNSEDAREQQDVGLEGLKNSREREFPHIKSFLDAVRTKVTNSARRRELEEDPSADDFKFFLDDSFTEDDFIVERYKNYLGMENNSPPINDVQNITPASTVQADKEDINEDNTINDVESFHQYSIDLRPGNLTVGNGYVVDKVIGTGNAEWLLFRIPLRTTDKSIYESIGGISGFKSIRFMRMLMTDWEKPVVLRFAALQLVANSYRTYTQDLNNNDINDVPELNDANFKVTTVSVEENGCTEEGDCNVKAGQTPYVVPPGFIRDRDLTQQIFRQFNEQSVSMEVTNLLDGDKRGIFKNTQLDLNMYKRIKMFVHMENESNADLGGAFIRFGTDLKRNYYEIEIPRLKATPNGTGDDAEAIWPEENEFDFALDDLREFKLERNKALGTDSSVALDRPYTRSKEIVGTDYLEMLNTQTYNLTVVGNPDFSNNLVWMVGISNPKNENEIGSPESLKIWVNELRANGFDQTKGEAGIMSADIKLADIGTVSISANMNTFGFGGVQSGISSRSRETAQGFGIASTLELDKFMPEKWGWSIPLFMNYDQQTIKPHFNPLDPDIVLERTLQQFDTEAERQVYRDLVIDQTVNKGFNLANVRKIKTDPAAKAHLYDIENFSFSYAQNSLKRSNVLLEEYSSEQQKGALAYEFSPKQILWEPFKASKKLEKPTWGWVKDFNFSPIPNLFAFRTDFDRSFIKTQYRTKNDDGTFGTEGVDPNFIKYFNTNRFYDVQWDFTKSINFNYSAQMRSLIDEPYGEKDREAVWSNLKSFGRANYFTQSIQATYALPLEKFFLLDWIKSDARFNADYIFRANAWDFNQGTSITDENDAPFGNFIENNREYAFQGQIDLVSLYNKLKYLRFANSPDAPKDRFTRAPGVEDEVTLPTSDLLKKFTRLLMTVRGVNFNFVRTEGTILPGFLPTPNLIGLAKGTQAPGLGFAMLGSQNINLEQFAKDGWLSNSTVRNDPFTRNRQTKFDFSTNLEPWTGFRMQIRGNYARGDSYQEIYKPDENGVFGASNPFRNGTFSMSFWSFKTVFKKMDDNPETNYQYEVFENMKTNREEVIRRIYAQRNNIEYNAIVNTPVAELSNSNLNPNSQDVLIPAFFAAYTGNTVDNLFQKVSKRGQETFNPFLRFPMPNWRIDYGGLEKLPLFNKMFSSLTLSHSYSSTYSVGNFTSSLLYGREFVNLDQNSYLLGSQTGLFNSGGSSFDVFLPVFIMSAITMEERYSPLIGVQFTLKNKISGRFQYNKERRASLNLSNTQVAEQNSDDWVFGFGFKKAGIKLPFRGRDGNLVVLKNDVNFRFDLTLRDQKLLQRRLDYQYANSAEDGTYGEVIPIQGNYNFQLRPQVQYQFNKKLSMSFYIEHFKNLPFTSITFARSQTVGGLNMRFNLAD